MTREALIVAILVGIILLWATEILQMSKTKKIINGVLDIGFALLK